MLSETLQAGEELQAVAQAALEADGDVFGFRFSQDHLQELTGTLLEFSGCVFEHCIFEPQSVKRISFVDCVFQKCELSNAKFDNATFQRTYFDNCRMTGVEFTRGTMMNVAFVECMLDYLSVAETKLDRVSFSDCRMRQSLWSSVKLQKATFQNADLIQTQWMRTSLAGLDMTSCEIEGWTIDLFDLRGLTVTAVQAVQLSGLLGIVIAP
ncbi:MAG: pentapeptide repeat-containing protein [Clostridia bacterium]